MPALLGGGVAGALSRWALLKVAVLSKFLLSPRSSSAPLKNHKTENQTRCDVGVGALELPATRRGGASWLGCF